jgi:hypothetical protein
MATNTQIPTGLGSEILNITLALLLLGAFVAYVAWVLKGQKDDDSGETK